jgi:uncharacterized membrane protein
MTNDSESLAARAVQEQKDAARAQSGKTFQDAENLPRRYKLYDRIQEHLSLRGVNIVIIVTTLLIVGLLIYGILTANPVR